MANKFFTSESLTTLVDEIKSYIKTAVSNHTHTATDIDAVATDDVATTSEVKTYLSI